MGRRRSPPTAPSRPPRAVRPALPRHRHPADRGQRDVWGHHRHQLHRPSSTNGADIEVGAGEEAEPPRRPADPRRGRPGRLVPAARRRHAEQDERRRRGIADVGIPVENDGTVTVGGGHDDSLGGSSGSSGQWAPAAGGFVNFGGGTHSVGGSTIAGAGTVYGSYEVASGQTVTVNGNYRWDNSTTIAGAGHDADHPERHPHSPRGRGRPALPRHRHPADRGQRDVRGHHRHQLPHRPHERRRHRGRRGLGRGLNLRDDQLILDGDGPGDSSCACSQAAR